MKTTKNTKKEQSITCPKCGTEINIAELMKSQVADLVNQQINDEREKYFKELENIQLKLEDEKNEEIKKFQCDLQKKSDKKIAEAIKHTLEEQAIEKSQLEEELIEKSNQLKEYNKLKAEKARLEREKDELEDKLKADAEIELNIKLAEEKQKMLQLAEEKFELRTKELEKQLEDQKKLTEQMRRKQEQGSMQLQGEVQELAIEDYLLQTFKIDEIQEIKKGDYGADTLQIVNTQYKPNCGSIYYESKRAKSFKEDWVEKLKKDAQEICADIAVLVTSIYPKGMTRMGLYNGIYVCSLQEFKGLSIVLRETIIKLSETKNMQENRYEKSELLYNYLTSSEFKLQIEIITSAFINMQNDLNAEKRAMNRIWKKREKEIQNVITATTDMYGSIQGISGNAIESEYLDLPLLEDKEIDREEEG